MTGLALAGTAAASGVSLTEPFDDLAMAHDSARTLDMSEHFGGSDLTYEVTVTTTHKRTGQVKTEPINTVARNKVRGNWSGDVLTLTAGASGHHELEIEVTATYATGGTASDSFQLTVGASESGSESLAVQSLRNALASQARLLLEEAFSTVGSRMASGAAGSDALTVFAGLFGGEGPGGCPLEESLEDCMTRGTPGGDALSFGRADDGFGSFAFDGQGSGEQGWSGTLSDLRDLAGSRGFAISLNRSLPQASFSQESASASSDASQHDTAADEGLQLTLWGRGSQAAGGGNALFWGMDASMGGQWMTGIALAESGDSITASLSQGSTHVSGFAESEVSAVYPYAKARFGNGLSLWGLAGTGTGEVDGNWTGLSLTGALPEEIRLEGDLAFSMGLIGAEHLLYEGGGLSLSAVGDAGWSRLAVESGTASGIAAAVSRTRIGLEAQYAALESGWSSSLRVSGRVDGGDGETGSGAELAGHVNRSWDRWQMGLESHRYTASSGLGRRGVAAALGLRAQDDGTGLSFSLAPGWGTGMAEGVDSRLLAVDEAAVEARPVAHLGGRVAWGTRSGTGLLTPHAGFRLDQDGGRHVRAGLVFEGPVSLSLAAERQETGDSPANHAIMFRMDTSF